MLRPYGPREDCYKCSTPRCLAQRGVLGEGFRGARSMFIFGASAIVLVLVITIVVMGGWIGGDDRH